MKKLIALLLVLVMALGVVACAPATNTPTTAPTKISYLLSQWSFLLTVMRVSLPHKPLRGIPALTTVGSDYPCVILAAVLAIQLIS